MYRTLWLGFFACLLCVEIGCVSPCNRRPPPPPPAVVVPAPAPIVQPVRSAPVCCPQPNGALLPAGGFQTLPPAEIRNPPPGANPVPAGPFPTAPPNSPSGQEPPIGNPPPGNQAQSQYETQWQPIEAREPAPSSSLSPRADSSRDAPRFHLYAPEPVEKDAPKDVFTPEPPVLEKEKKQPLEIPPLKKPGVQAGMPSIAQFADVKENVFAGLRPPLDGLDWLQANGVKTVVQIRLTGEDDSADRKQVEKRGMRYVALEVTPQTLTKVKVDEFIKLVRDGAKHSLFVYDQDGALAGSMWYLYFRWGEFIDDEASQLRARSFGLQQNRDGMYRDMWLAVQKLLAQ